MKDFSKWAELSTKGETNLWPIFLCCVAGLLIVGMVCFLLMDALEGVFEFVFGVLLAGAFLVAMLGLAVAGQEESSTEAEDKSSDTAIFTVQVEKEFGVRNLSCPGQGYGRDVRPARHGHIPMHRLGRQGRFDSKGRDAHRDGGQQSGTL